MVYSLWQISEIVSMKFRHVLKQKCDTGLHALDKFVKIQHGTIFSRFFIFWLQLIFLKSVFEGPVYTVYI